MALYEALQVHVLNLLEALRLRAFLVVALQVLEVLFVPAVLQTVLFLVQVTLVDQAP